MSLSDILDYRIKSGTKAFKVFALSDELYPMNIKKKAILFPAFTAQSLYSFVCFIRVRMYMSFS